MVRNYICVMLGPVVVYCIERMTGMFEPFVFNDVTMWWGGASTLLVFNVITGWSE